MCTKCGEVCAKVPKTEKLAHCKVTISSCVVLETTTEDAGDGTARDTRITSKQAVVPLSCMATGEEKQASVIDSTEEHQPSTSTKLEDLIDLKKPPLEPIATAQESATAIVMEIVQDGEYC